MKRWLFHARIEKGFNVKRFNVAVVGCGNVAQMHFEAYTAHPERIRLVATCDLDRVSVDQAQEKYGIKKGFGSVEEMLNEADWEVGVVCTPTPVRREVIEKLSAGGKHIYVEKPFAETLAEAQLMVEICGRAGVTLAVNQNFRFHYPFDIARTLIAEGRIGEVVSVNHQNLQFRQDAGWRTKAERHSLSIMGVHWFDGFRWMLNDDAQSIIGEVKSSRAIDCAGETDTHFQLKFGRDAVVSYVESFSSGYRKTETVAIGETGTLRYDYDGLDLYETNRSNTPVEHWEAPYRRERKPEATFLGLNEVLTALENGTEPANSGRDNLKTVALLDGAYRSAAEHRKVSLQEGVLA